MMDTLRSYKQVLKTHFSKAIAANDDAHQCDHFDDVFETGLYINSQLELNFSPLAILTVAYVHDLFAWSRDNHHVLSYEFMKTTEDPLIKEILQVLDDPFSVYTDLDMDSRTMLADACHEHRASFSGSFSHSFSELMNSADRGRPSGIGDVLNRAYRYAVDKNAHLSNKDCMLKAIHHVKDKFSRDGYARLPSMYMAVYSDQQERLWDEVDALNKSDVESWLCKLESTSGVKK